MQGVSRRTYVLLFTLFVSILTLSNVQADGESTNQFGVQEILPLATALMVSTLVWRWFIPNQLSNLQVAFEIDDDLYEVHRITRDREDARELLGEGSVGYGVGLYMMGMTGVLILIAEFIFDPYVVKLGGYVQIFTIFILITLSIFSFYSKKIFK